jgi:hypothetical protein
MIRSSFVLTLLTCFPVDLINGTYACENDKVMNDIIKREYGFQGCEYPFIPSKLSTDVLHFTVIVTDWAA